MKTISGRCIAIKLERLSPSNPRYNPKIEHTLKSSSSDGNNNSDTGANGYKKTMNSQEIRLRRPDEGKKKHSP